MRERTKRGKSDDISDLLNLRVKNPSSKLKLLEYFFREKIFFERRAILRATFFWRGLQQAGRTKASKPFNFKTEKSEEKKPYGVSLSH